MCVCTGGTFVRSWTRRVLVLVLCDEKNEERGDRVVNDHARGRRWMDGSIDRSIGGADPFDRGFARSRGSIDRSVEGPRAWTDGLHIESRLVDRYRRSRARPPLRRRARPRRRGAARSIHSRGGHLRETSTRTDDARARRTDARDGRTDGRTVAVAATVSRVTSRVVVHSRIHSFEPGRPVSVAARGDDGGGVPSPRREVFHGGAGERESTRWWEKNDDDRWSM